MPIYLNMQKANFRYLPHTADVAFIAHGKSFKEALENAAMALLGTMFDTKELKLLKAKTSTVRIHESASNDGDVAWFVLQDMVSKIDEKGIQAFKFKVNHIKTVAGKTKVNCCIFYKRTKEYHALLDVKAVTPSEFKVQKIRGRWSIKAILDV